jgi:hypothetical protein
MKHVLRDDNLSPIALTLDSEQLTKKIFGLSFQFLDCIAADSLEKKIAGRASRKNFLFAVKHKSNLRSPSKLTLEVNEQ